MTGQIQGGISDRRKQYGYTLKKINGLTSAADCQLECAKDKDCNHFDFYKPNGNCYLRKLRDTNSWSTIKAGCVTTRMLDFEKNKYYYGIFIVILIIVIFGIHKLIK